MPFSVATPALAPGQALYPHLLAPLDLGFTAHRMGGALDARAIDQTARLTARL
ncbi:hypothetical protein [Acidovorax sp. JHL-9]|uniref:hypothetical protein n=1 Tax=Acidovorax sp. JHL-9 TaxID=1276756 RepID=UPI000401907E|nr:hypothetical protein [Acidovorax sp. JHL-9]